VVGHRQAEALCFSKAPARTRRARRPNPGSSKRTSRGDCRCLRPSPGARSPLPPLAARRGRLRTRAARDPSRRRRSPGPRVLWPTASARSSGPIIWGDDDPQPPAVAFSCALPAGCSWDYGPGEGGAGAPIRALGASPSSSVPPWTPSSRNRPPGVSAGGKGRA
jgi:hypothetical protein